MSGLNKEKCDSMLSLAFPSQVVTEQSKLIDLTFKILNNEYKNLQENNEKEIKNRIL
jgi:hypothetical protein